MWSVPSTIVRWLALNDGAIVFNIWLVSVLVDSLISSLVITSTGTEVSSRLRGVRAPMIVMTSPSLFSASWTSRTAGPAPTITVRSTARYPGASTRTVYSPGGTDRIVFPFLIGEHVGPELGDAHAGADLGSVILGGDDSTQRRARLLGTCGVREEQNADSDERCAPTQNVTNCFHPHGARDPITAIRHLPAGGSGSVGAS